MNRNGGWPAAISRQRSAGRCSFSVDLKPAAGSRQPPMLVFHNRRGLPSSAEGDNLKRSRREMTMRPLLLATVSLSLFSTLLPAQGHARAPLTVTEWKVPWEKTRPRDPYVDAKGRVWFVGQEGNY